LLSSQINYTLTNFAEHSAHFRHDAINRYLAGDQITPCLVWENVQGQVVQVETVIWSSMIRSPRRISRSALNWFAASTAATRTA
jgi:hypothetical protein